MNTTFKYIAVITSLLLIGGAFYLKVYMPKTTFTTVSPSIGEIKVSVSGIGNVEAKDIYNITAQSGGKIIDITACEGEWVKKGDLLIEMDGVDLPDQLEIAKATLKKSEFELIASQSELKNQQTQKALLEKTYGRYAELNKQGYAAQSEYDKALADLQSIDMMMLVSKSHINSAKAQILLSQKSMQAIKTKIANLKVYAPVDGYVITKEAEVAQNVLPTNTILKIVDAKTLWVEVQIDERISGAITLGQKASIVLSSQPDNIYEGVVRRILPVSDLVTLEREVDVAFTVIPKPFYINEQAEVSIETNAYSDVLKIPLNVVVQEGGKMGVWIAKDGHAFFKAVKKIAVNKEAMAVSDLDKESMLIVPDSTKKPLTEGMRIH
ncbi:MAG: efflux RND transporter periplasmic adaptor subunit [Helicobacteraceae bacterium]|jgi:RND family efflux transporter MFP subunit|nr:efflux RND transporter periplasmic adaptor subunit [Helicobacteraceae bacterium]